MLSIAPLFRCTCGHAFETQRVLDLHKRDSLYHKRQDGNVSTRHRQWDDFLASSFASLNLQSVSTQSRPPLVSHYCVCGRTFTDQESFAQHKQDVGRHLLQRKQHTVGRIFNTSQQQYQENEYLQVMAFEQQ